MNRFIVIIHLLFTLIELGAIEKEFWGKSAYELKFKHLQMQDGLSSNVTSCIIQDRDGFMWFGTDAGLNRYDGKKIKIFTYGKNKPDGLSNSVIKCLYQDRKGLIWIGTDRGLNVYNPETEKISFYLNQSNDSTSLSNNTITSITEDEKGQLWIGTFKGINVLYKWKNKTPLFKRIFNDPTDLNSLSNDRICCIFCDIHGHLWIGTEGGGLNHLSLEMNDNNTFHFQRFRHNPTNPSSINSDIIYTITEDQSDRLMIGTGDGLSILSQQNGLYRFKNYQAYSDIENSLKENRVFSIIQDSQGRIWLGTFGGGLVLFNPQTKTFSTYKNDILNTRSISRDYIYSLYESKDGILWIATRETGIDRVDPEQQKFLHLRHIPGISNSLSNKVVKSITETDDGRFWFGTYGGGITLFDPKTKQYQHINPLSSIAKKNSSLIVESICFDRENNLWAGTSQGLIQFDKNLNLKQHFQNDPTQSSSLTHNDIWFLYPSKIMNGVWIATYDGLDFFEWSTGQFHHFKHDAFNDTSLSFNYVRMIYEDNGGNLWVCSWGGGLNKLDVNDYNATGKAHFTHYQHNPNDSLSISSDLVNTFFEDSKGRFWVGTQEGLNLFHPESGEFTHYSELNGLADNVIKGILEDQEGHIWISTQKGLSCFLPETTTFKNFFEKDGLQGNVFNLTSCLLNSRGELMFAGNNGVTVFRSSDLKQMKNFPTAYLTSFKVNNCTIIPQTSYNKRNILSNNLSETKQITLKHFEDVISIDFSTIEYSSPERIKFSYRLLNVDKTWNQTDNRLTHITYSNLTPGEYTFEVKASNLDGIWPEKSKNLKIKVLPPLWATKAAFLLYALLSILILLYLRKILTARILIRNELKKEKEERRKQAELDQFKFQFFTNISHEIRTPLTLISGPLQKLLKESENLSQEAQKSYYNTMDRNVKLLLRLVNQLLDFRKAENEKMKLQVQNGDLALFLKDIIGGFKEFASQKQVKLELKTPEQFMAWYDRDKLEKIVYNLISNALKFTPSNGNITVILDKKDACGQLNGNDDFSIQVKDTGPGIAPEHLEYIFERFSQLKKGKPLAGGTGIGLAFTKKLVELHKGTITVVSEEGKGSTFSCTLPGHKTCYKAEELLSNSQLLSYETIAQNNDEQCRLSIEEYKRENSNDEKLSNQKVKLLITEDYPDMRSFIKDAMRSDYQIIEASNGKEGLEKALQFNPDLVITDIMMPEMDGIEFCNQLKKNINISHIPVIMLTAKNSPEHELEGLENGADYYITKPFNIEHLKLIIKNALHTREHFQLKFNGLKLPEPSEVTTTSPDEILLKKIAETLEKYISDPELSNEKLAQECDLSPAQLYRKIKALTRMSTHKFIRSFRLKRAAQLLVQNKLRISEVAYMVGFCDPKYFRKCFKEEFGMSPTAYSKSHAPTDTTI